MLKIENISKTFNPGTINEKAALQGLSLHLLPGDFVTIIGSNGAGKSTLFNEHTAALDPATAEKVLEITRQTVSENHITTLMVTHNMHQALELGNRTLMMDRGHIILDVAGAERAGMTVEDLLAKFKSGAGKALDNDRILLSE